MSIATFSCSRMACLALLALLALRLTVCLADVVRSSNNSPVRLLNLVQNSPGDPLGRQQTKFTDPTYLANLGFTGDVATGENSAGLVVDYASLGIDIWPRGSPERTWRDAQLVHLKEWIQERKDAGVAAFFWIDMVVLPKALVRHYGNKVLTKKLVDFRKPMTKKIVKVYFEEMFETFPTMDGVIVRTGETYVEDTPFHMGNSPVDRGFNLTVAKQNDLWVEFISLLRSCVSVKANRYAFFRTWDNFDGWNSTAKEYRAVMDRVVPHDKFYVSIKQQAGDYFRYAKWNPQIGVGHHPQIVEISAQRAWEGKGAYPNYNTDEVIAGYSELPAKERVGLNHYVGNETLLKGIWIWSRGDGWYGPYLKGNEVWPSLMSQTLARYWLANGTLSEEQAFVTSCTTTYHLDDRACSALRQVGQIGAQATLHMRYCPEIATVGDACWAWYRDDRVGGVHELGDQLHRIRRKGLSAKAIHNRQKAVVLMRQAQSLLSSAVLPHVSNPQLGRFLRAHAEYGVRHFSVMEAGWRVMLHGLDFKANHSSISNRTLLERAIADYKAKYAGYKTLVLLSDSPSLFFDYYFSLPGDPPAPGIGATVDFFQKLLVNSTMASEQRVVADFDARIQL